MGFLQAMQQMGRSEAKEGLESYLMRPMDKDGKQIRVWLKVDGDLEKPLEIKGVAKIDLADYNADRVTLGEYLYRKPAGSNTTWAFSPVHKAGKMKNDADKNLEALCPEGWESNSDTHFYKMKHRILNDYEKEAYFTPGSVDLIMKEMKEKIHQVIDDLDSKQSYIVIFGVEKDGKFLYPGQVPAFVKYFQQKLAANLGKGNSKNAKDGSNICSLCNEHVSSPLNLNKIFKFNTFDKVSVLAGLDKNEIPYNFPVCQNCFENISAGRENVDRLLINTGVLPKVNIWAIPEAVGEGNDEIFKIFLNNWANKLDESELEGIGEKREKLYFSRLAKIGQSLIFHFVFWEKNNAQEILHLMVEDVPPERLAGLESTWQRVTKDSFGWKNQTSLDFAIRSLYATLINFAGKSEGDKKVFKDFALEIIGKMLQEELLPVDMFKSFVVSRLARLVYEGNPKEYRKAMNYAQIWVEYMTAINQEVSK